MKLPDFLEFAPFNQLRQQMDATQLGDFSLVISFQTITHEEEKQLESSGIEIDSLDAICELEDGTLAFKDSRVLLYIRDINVSSGRYSQKKTLPRFHVSWCSTLQTMKDDKRFDRYVLSTRTDGIFEIRKTGKYSSNISISNEPLVVCKNCLDKLNYNGFRYGTSQDKNNKIFGIFSLGYFFDKYPKSPLNSKPKPRYTSVTAPTDVYPDNFQEISHKYRIKRGWKCENCGIVLAQPNQRKYLHTHHCNGRKHDNTDKNLRALCISCHANQAGHKEMKSTPDYRNFMRIKSGLHSA